MRDAEEEQAHHKLLAKVGEWVMALGAGRGCEGAAGGVLTEFRVRMPREDEPMALLIVKVTGEDAKYIGFIGAPTAEAALLAWRARDGKGGLKWRVDLPWGERGE